jgi:hypothetical protein
MPVSPIELMSNRWHDINATAPLTAPAEVPVTAPINAGDTLVTTLPSPHKVAANHYVNPGTPDKILKFELPDPLHSKANSRSIVPLLDPPKEMVIEDIDTLATFISVHLVKESKSLLQIKHKLVEAERAIRDEFAKRERDAVHDVADKSHTERMWSLFDKIATAVAFFISACFSSFSGIGIPLLITGAILTMDQVCDDYLKKHVAKWLSKGNKESEEAWLQRLQIGCGIILVGCSLGIASPQLIRASLSLAQGASQMVKGVAKYRANLTRATLMELSEAVKGSKLIIDLLLQSAQRTITTIHELYRNILQIDRGKRHLISGFFSSVSRA